MAFKMRGFSGFKYSPVKKRSGELTGGNVIKEEKQPDNCPKRIKKHHGENATCKRGGGSSPKTSDYTYDVNKEIKYQFHK